ncbi:MAG TPA: asparagine synthase-related protein [Steroidobacteraceae bacterium]|nr:asparagine synthase-related protein [Steroidobacteraceae bacterium]
MFGYIAAVWHPDSADPAHPALQTLAHTDPRWSLTLSARGLLLYTAPDRYSRDTSVLLSRRRGVILGTVFATTESEQSLTLPVHQLPEKIAEDILLSHGRALTTTHWGSYVAILTDPANATVTVFRGPMARLPCFYIQLNPIHLFFSRMQDLVSLRMTRLAVNYAAIRAQATGGDYITAETGIESVSSVLPGEAVHIAASGVRRESYWSPRQFAKRTQDIPFTQAVQRIKSGTRTSIRAWASLHQRMLVSLSGGFDSSVVLSHLRRSPGQHEVVGVNFFDGASADERHFARSMGVHTQTEVIERRWNPRVDFHRFLSCALTAAPPLSFVAFDFEPACLEIAQERQATAIFSGEIGDDIFGRTVGPELISDCIWRYGWGPKLLAATADYAQFKRLSVWEALAQGRRYHRFRAHEPYWSVARYLMTFHKKAIGGLGTTRSLIHEEALNDYQRNLDRFIHPWFQEMHAVPPGWFQLVRDLIVGSSTWWHSPFAGERDAMFVHPLFSQPLVEAYFQIPARLHIAGGHSGAVARQAFADHLSPEVLKRGRGKGTPDAWLVQAIQRNREFLREFLLDGVLVRERILDRGKVEATLSGRAGGAMTSVCDLIAQLYIEGWLRRWTEVSLQAAA